MKKKNNLDDINIIDNVNLSSRELVKIFESLDDEMKHVDLTKSEIKLRVLNKRESQSLTIEAKEYLSKITKNSTIDSMMFEDVIDSFCDSKAEIGVLEIKEFLKKYDLNEEILLN